MEYTSSKHKSIISRSKVRKETAKTGDVKETIILQRHKLHNVEGKRFFSYTI